MAEVKTTAPSVSNEKPFVLIKLPVDRNNKEDEVVWINARRFLIKKGVPVSVPVSVAKALENRDFMLEYCADYEAKVSK